VGQTRPHPQQQLHNHVDLQQSCWPSKTPCAARTPPPPPPPPPPPSPPPGLSTHSPVQHPLLVLWPLLAEHDEALPVLTRPVLKYLDQPVIYLLVLGLAELGLSLG